MRKETKKKRGATSFPGDEDKGVTKPIVCDMRYLWPNWIVSLPFAGLICSSSSSPWPPTAFSSHAVSSSSLSPDDDDGRPSLRIDRKRSLKRCAYSSCLGGCSVTSGRALDCETGINCLYQGMSFQSWGARNQAHARYGMGRTHSDVSAQMRSRVSRWRRSSSGSGWGTLCVPLAVP